MLPCLDDLTVLIGQVVVMAHRPSHGGCYALHVTVVDLSIKHTQIRKAQPCQLTSHRFLASKKASDLLETRTGWAMSDKHMLASHASKNGRE